MKTAKAEFFVGLFLSQGAVKFPKIEV